MGWIDSQFPSGVSISPSSSTLTAGAEVALNASGGTIYYTLDGSDPRLPGGGINASALTLGGGEARP